MPKDTESVKKEREKKNLLHFYIPVKDKWKVNFFFKAL